MIEIDNLISEATKQKSPALGLYRLIKTEFLRWMKDNPGKELDATTEAKILKKMYDQRNESIKIYEAAGRKDLLEKEAEELAYLTPFLPKETPVEEIENYTRQIITDVYGGKISMKDMRTILGKVQEKYPDAAGKVVSNVVKSYGS